MTVTAHLISGESLEQTADGWRSQAQYQVDGVTGSAAGKLYQAMSNSNVPQFGDPHPVLSLLRVSNRSARPITDASTQVVVITITYEQPTSEQQTPSETEQSQIQVGSSVESVVTQRDVDGNQILVTHTYSKTDAEGNVQEVTQTQGGEVEYQVPSTSFSFSRREPQSPGDKSLLYVGKINSAFFAGAPAGHWLCTRIEGSSDDGGQSYNVTYEFQRNSEGWAATVVFIDTDTGRPPPFLVEGVGIKDIEVYRRIDFNALNLGGT